MTTEKSQTTDEAQIRALIEARAKAVHAKDIEGLLENIAPDILSFDVLNPLQKTGLDAERESAEAWISSYQSAIGYEIRDLSVSTGEEVAFSHYLYHVTGTTTDGSDVDMWVRATTCFRKIQGEWMIVHEHQSVPFDPESGQASLDLKP